MNWMSTGLIFKSLYSVNCHFIRDDETVLLEIQLSQKREIPRGSIGYLTSLGFLEF